MKNVRLTNLTMAIAIGLLASCASDPVYKGVNRCFQWDTECIEQYKEETNRIARMSPQDRALWYRVNMSNVRLIQGIGQGFNDNMKQAMEPINNHDDNYYWGQD